MQIIVCVAVTPSTETRVKIGADGRSLDAADVKYELNPYDEFALEEALRIKEKAGTGEVTVVTVGDGSQKEELRKCLARGADKAVILKADVSKADSAGIAAALGAFIQKHDAKIVFLGKQSVDSDNAQVPHHLAHLLGWPAVTKISKLEIQDAAFTAHREIEGGIEIIEGALPCVFSAEKGLNEPRYPSLKGIMAAKKKPLEEIDTAIPSPKVVVEKLELPAARPDGRIVGEGQAAVDALVALLRNEAKVI
jgi:electron transfer flavoprotein beta subunit